MFRVYDIVSKKWMEDENIYMSSVDDLYMLKKRGIFGDKLKQLPDDRYVYHKYIELCDKDDKAIYEGDYLEAEVDGNETIIGIVVFAHEFAAYIILCNDIDKYYILGDSVCKNIKIIGNVFDGYERQ